MMEFLKKQSAGFVIDSIAVILALIAMLIYISNGNTAYYNDFNAKVVVLTVGAIIVQIVLMIVVQRVGEKKYLDIAYVVAPILLGIAVMIFISFRVQSVGLILGSDLEKDNVVAIKALNQAFTGIFFYVMAMIASIVGSFLSQKKTD